MTNDPFYVGLLFLHSPFGEELLTRLNQLPPFQNQEGQWVQIEAEHIPIHELDINAPIKYHLIIDRVSYLLKQSVGILMGYAFRGVHIINNPLSFHYFLEHKDVGYTLATALGIHVPRTFILPTCRTPYLTLDDFKYHRPFDWNTMIQHIRFPCILKPAGGRAGRDVYLAHNLEELLFLYNRTGTKVMLLQEQIQTPHDWQLRCICIGRQVLICKYRFGLHDTSRYIEDSHFLSKEQEQQIIHICRVLNRIHGYEMNSVEFILDQKGVPWAVDFNNPIPDGRKEALGKHFYEQYQSAMEQLVKDIAYYRTPSYFLPDLNPYSKIAQSSLSLPEKFKKALEEANKYYDGGMSV